MPLLLNTRQYRRFAAKLMVKITSGSLSFWALTSNISQKGLCIRANQEFPVNKVLDIELIMPDGQISSIKGMVKHVNESPQSQRRFGIGIEIIKNDTTFRDYLYDLEEKTILHSTHPADSAHTLDIKEEVLAPGVSETPDTSLSSHQEEAEAYEEAEVSAETSEEETRELSHISGRRGVPSRAKQGTGRGRWTGVVPVFLIMLLVLGMVTGGVVLYRSLMQDRGMLPARDLICSIQVGAFRSGANAQGLLQEYTDKGYTVFIDERDVRGTGVMYKVLIGPFQGRGDTAQVAEDIRAKENIDPFVTCQ
jgi:hypothetical protein